MGLIKRGIAVSAVPVGRQDAYLTGFIVILSTYLEFTGPILLGTDLQFLVRSPTLALSPDPLVLQPDPLVLSPDSLALLLDLLAFSPDALTVQPAPLALLLDPLAMQATT